MIALITDYGCDGPYLGQVQAAIYQYAPRARIVNLLADAPAHNPRSAGYMLPAYASVFPENTVFLCVVDPAVGSGTQRPVVVVGDGRRFIGPDNGLFDVVISHARRSEMWEILWRPDRLSPTFHGRDLYAPVAAKLDSNEEVDLRAVSLTEMPRCTPDLDEIIYIDHFGNAMTGRRAETLPRGSTMVAAGRWLRHGTSYHESTPGEAFWYENSNGLVEIAVNRGSAALLLGIQIGDPVTIQAPNSSQ
jgi:S-adenosylmethionine hydrolase